MVNRKQSCETLDKANLKGKKILSIYYRHKPGGFCKRLYLMFEALVAAGGEVHYVAVEPYPISHPRIIPHILWTPFQKKEGLFFWVYFICIAPFYLFVIGHRENVHLVSVFGGLYGFMAILLKLLLQKPVMIFVRADIREIGQILGRPSYLLFIWEIMSKLGFKLSDAIITVNHRLKKTISTRYGLSAEKIEVLPNHIPNLLEGHFVKEECRKKLKLEKEVFVIVTVAVLDSRKNIDFLIRTASYLEKSALFLIVGDGQEKKKLEILAGDVAGDAKIIFTGWQADVSDFLKASDLFVLPSKHEGASNALLEALAYGLPCLASHVSENREILQFDQLIFDPIDEQAFSDKLRSAMFDQNVLQEIKSLSEQVAKDLVFDWNKKIVRFHAQLLFS